jgi:hypothetical protein
VPYSNDHFALPGKIVLTVKPGTYTFEIERGLEYVTCGGHFVMEKNAGDSEQIELRRFVDMSEQGWWSGDLDVRRDAADIEAAMLADDLHVVPLITWWNDQSPRKRILPEQALVTFNNDRLYHLLGGGYAWPGGQLLIFNLPAPPARVVQKGDHPPIVRQIHEARQYPGVWSDLAAPFAWDLPMLIAHGQLDSVQVAHRGICRKSVINHEQGGKPRDTLLFPGAWGNARWSQEIYFRLLNCGIKLPPSAGSGSGKSPNPVGYNRVYVHVDGPFSYEKWWEAFGAGRVTITNGPLLRPKVHGQLPGYTFHSPPGQSVELDPGLTLSTREPISYLEIIKDGKVEHSIRFDEYKKSGRLPRIKFDESGWFVIRAVTDVRETYRFAMTGPYYVEIGEKPRISKSSAQFFLDWVYERARQIQLDDPEQNQEVLALHRHARDYWQAMVNRATAE